MTVIQKYTIDNHAVIRLSLFTILDELDDKCRCGAAEAETSVWDARRSDVNDDWDLDGRNKRSSLRIRRLRLPILSAVLFRSTKL